LGKKAIVKAQQAEALVGAAPDQAARPGEKGENPSPFRVTELPPDFDFIASKTDDEKIDYIRSVLARSEDEAIDIIAPALQIYGSAGSMVEAYLPLILEVKKHFCRPGRPRTDPATGKRNRTWEEVCEEHFRIGIRRMQQILASLRQPKLPGGVGAASRKPPIDRKDYERARRVAAPAASLAQAVVKQGLAGKFPEAIEILKLADIPVPAAPSTAIAVDKIEIAGSPDSAPTPLRVLENPLKDWDATFEPLDRCEKVRAMIALFKAIGMTERDAALQAEALAQAYLETEAEMKARVKAKTEAELEKWIKRSNARKAARDAARALGSASGQQASAASPTTASTGGDAGTSAPAQGEANTNKSQEEPDRRAANLSPIAEPTAATAQSNPLTVSPGDWITFDPSCKYVGRFLSRKGRSKRFVVMTWRRKPGWYQTVVDFFERRLSEEEVREKFPRAWQEWWLLHPENAPGAAPQLGPNPACAGSALPTPAPEVASREKGLVPSAAAPPDDPSGQDNWTAPATRPPRSVPSFTDSKCGTVKPGYLCKYNDSDCEITKVVSVR
jgi:hypothetical protein